MSVGSFLNLLNELEEECWQSLETCINPRCPNRADYLLVRLSLCPCHESIKFGVCRFCRDESVSEKIIENEMRLAHLHGIQHSPAEFEQLIQESLGQDWW
jgi:hypothetical protein